MRYSLLFLAACGNAPDIETLCPAPALVVQLPEGYCGAEVWVCPPGEACYQRPAIPISGGIEADCPAGQPVEVWFTECQGGGS